MCRPMWYDIIILGFSIAYSSIIMIVTALCDV